MGDCASRALPPVPLSELMRLLEQETPEDYWSSPRGFVVHGGRVGSTALANMLGSLPDVVALKEPEAFTDLLLSAAPSADEADSPLRSLTHAFRARALRAVAHLFFRASASLRLGATNDRAYAGRTSLVVKLSTAGTAWPSSLRLLRAAFPSTPFVYLVREPAASLASLLAPASRLELHDAPCLRWRARLPEHQLPGLLAVAGAADPLELSAEQYCAAHVHALYAAMGRQLDEDRASGGESREGGSLGRGVSLGAPLSLVIDHSDLPDAVPSRVLPHLSLRASAAETSALLRAGGLDAKDGRATAPGYAARVPSPAAARWATAYAAEAYARVLGGGGGACDDMSGAAAAALAAAQTAALAARANHTVGVGMLMHSGGVGGREPSRRCDAADDEALAASAIAELGMGRFRRGDLFGAEACWLAALKRPDGADSTRASIALNLAMLEDLLERRTRRRVLIPPRVSSAPLYPRAETLEAARAHDAARRRATEASLPSLDPAVAVYDGVLSDDLCDEIIAAFESAEGRAEHYAGSVSRGDGFVVDTEGKLTTEIDVSRSPSAVWQGVDLLLLQGVLRALADYSELNPGVDAPQQMRDEGFRLKRYLPSEPPEPPQHHAWHVDSGSSGTGCRAIAALLYLNDVPSGGETVFMRPQPVEVRPARGRLLLFPAGLGFVHAGAPPHSAAKYVASNFLSSCGELPVEAAHFFPPLPLLNASRVHELRTRWATPPHAVRAGGGGFLRLEEAAAAAAGGENGGGGGGENGGGGGENGGGGGGGEKGVSGEEGVTLPDPEPPPPPFSQPPPAASTASSSQMQALAGRLNRLPSRSSTQPPSAPWADRLDAAVEAAVAEAGGDKGDDGGPEPECGAAFRSAAAAYLEASQTPPDCSTARLLIAGGDPKDFEGVGSTLMAAVYAQAQAVHSHRTLLWGPRETHPPIFRGANCSAEAASDTFGFSCYFERLGSCEWHAHVFRSEALRFIPEPYSDVSRVTMSTPLRGAALYVPPPPLHALLPSSVGDSAVRTAECWAGAVARRVLRLRKSVRSYLEARLAESSSGGGGDAQSPRFSAASAFSTSPILGAHFRSGDIVTVVDVSGGTDRQYSNREMPRAEHLVEAAARLLPMLPTAADRNATGLPPLVYLATDDEDAAGIADALAGAANASVRFAGGAFRHAMGSHTTAFAATGMSDEHGLPLPYNQAASAVREIGGAAEVSAAQERVRRDALLDLFALSRCAGLVGAASSTFAVLARHWAVGRGHGLLGMVAWTDLDGVVSGELATGFLRGMRHGTKRIVGNGADRHQVALSRLLGRPLLPTDPPIQMDAATAVPIVPRDLFLQSVAPAWRSREPVTAHCACEPTVVPIKGDTDSDHPAKGCDVALLVNRGSAAYYGEVMNWEGAAGCWRRARMLPGRSAYAQFQIATNASVIGDVARTNLKELELRNFKEIGAAYANTREALVVRGGCREDEPENFKEDEIAASRRAPLLLHIDGWRGLAHSYALVAASLVSELASRCGVRLSWSDATSPFGNDRHRSRVTTPLPPNVRVLPPGEVPPGAVVVRIAWPYNLTAPAGAARLLVFATAEHLGCPGRIAEGSPSWGTLAHGMAVPTRLLTPSLYSLEGLASCGVPRERIALAPHGVSPAAYAPLDAEQRARRRKKRGWEGRFVFLHVGAGTPNKNLKMLLQAFASVAHSVGRDGGDRDGGWWGGNGTLRPTGKQQSRPLLVLKGLEALYGSSAKAKEALQAISPPLSVDGPDADVEIIGAQLSAADMAAMYQSADAYVSASMAEAFQLPLAEATAAGLQVVAPAGGAAEEIIDSRHAVLAPSILEPRSSGRGFVVRVDEAGLKEAMTFVLTNQTMAETARELGPSWATVRLSAEAAADAVLDAAFVGSW